MSDEFTTTPELPPLALADDFGDPETLLNSRDWLQKALESKGAKIIGGGCGAGSADLCIVLEGCEFNVSIRPIDDAWRHVEKVVRYVEVPEFREPDKDPIMTDQENSA